MQKYQNNKWIWYTMKQQALAIGAEMPLLFGRRTSWKAICWRAESSTSKHYFRQAIVKSSSCQWCDGSYLERAWYPVFETSARQLLLILTVESFTILRRIAPACKEREETIKLIEITHIQHSYHATITVR